MNKIINPNDPQMMNINGQNVDIGHGLVDANNKPIKKTKGSKLAQNKIEKERIIRHNKDMKIEEWVQEQLEGIIPKKQMKNVKNIKEADKVLDRHKIEVFVQKSEKTDFAAIIQGRNFRTPVILKSMMFAWKNG